MASTLSLRVIDDVEGGLFDDFDGTVTSARYQMYDYPNKAGKPSTDDGQPVLTVCVTLVNADAKDPIKQYYSVGARGFRPNPADGGKTAVADGDARGIGKMSNFATLRNELVSIGFPEERITDDVSFLDGLVAHWNQKAQPKRANAKPDEKEKKPLLVPTKILALPGEARIGKTAKSGASVGVKAAKTTKATGSDNGYDVAAATRATILTILARKPTLKPAELKMDVFRAEMKNPQRNAMLDLAVNEEFLMEGAVEGAWEFDGETISKSA